MLDVKDLAFGYRGREALRGIDLRFPEKGIVGLVGPNGSGKSTLLKCLNGILVARGKVTFDGLDIRRMSIRDRARIFGYVPQDTHSAFPIPVYDMIMLGRRTYIGWSPSDRDHRTVSGLISDLGMEEVSLRNVHELSGGERQKVLIARALAQEPKVLLLDEPTSNLDIRHQMEVMEHIRDMTLARGILAVTALHDLNLASHFCDMIVMLKDGRVHSRGPPSKVLKEGPIREVYGIDVLIHDHGGIAHVVPTVPHLGHRLTEGGHLHD